ncbi:MAG: hypothetical protein K2O59_15245 [Lachnospiraceae bacterium]|nr:hypothetical protein [Lachnospiraceae bacterium]
MNLVFGRTFNVVDDLYLNIVKQINFGEWIELDDLEALRYLEKLHNFSGQLCVINDYCYEKKCGPFLLNATDITHFAKHFITRYGQSFYATDIVIINFEEKLIWVLVHEGLGWLSKG